MNPSRSKKSCPSLLNHRALSTLIISLLSTTSCKPKISDANLEAVNQRYVKSELQERGSLSPKEVESILGPPDQTESTTIELETQKKQVPVTRFIYQQNGKQIELHFIDNKLIDKIQPWKAPTPPDSNQP